MNWLDKLERKFGRYAIRNLPLYIVMLYAIGAVLNIITRGGYYVYVALNPYLVLRGEVWRLLGFLIVPPNANIIFIIFVLMFYYSIGESLVQVWGAFRFNMYILLGVLATIIASFVVYFIYPSTMIFMDTFYLNLSMFLAYATIFPEMRVYLSGIVPVKVKWLAWVDVALLAYNFIVGNIGSKVAIAVSLLNFLLFYISSRNYKKVSPREIQRKRAYRKASSVASNKPYRHKCAVCGKTELDDLNLEFRYCSKCNGNYEYCNEHLFTHEHVK